MKVSQVEVGALVLISAYTAFYTNPPPTLVSDTLSTPLGLLVGLGVVVLLSLKVSLLVGLFSAVALLLSVKSSYESFELKKKEEPKKEQPTSQGVPEAQIKGALGRLLQTAGKSVTKPPPTTGVTKPADSGKKKDYTPVE